MNTTVNGQATVAERARDAAVNAGPLRRPAAVVNRALLRAIGASPFLRDAKRRHQVWENCFERLAR